MPHHSHGFALRPIDEFTESGFGLVGGENLHGSILVWPNDDVSIIFSESLDSGESHGALWQFWSLTVKSMIASASYFILMSLPMGYLKFAK